MYKKFKDYMTSSVIGNAVSLILAIIFFLFIANFDRVQANLNVFLKVISPFIYGFGLSYILNRPIKWFDVNIFSKITKKRSKLLSITCTYICFFIATFAFSIAIIPQTIETLMSILDNIPSFIEKISKFITNFLVEHDIEQSVMAEIDMMWQNVSKFISNIVATIVPQIVTASISVSSMIINMINALIASIYMHASKDTLIFQIKKFMYAFMDTTFANKVIRLGARADDIFAGFLVGKIIDSTIIGLITFIFMMFLHHPFAVLIAVIIGITNMIPFFGPFIGAVPCSLILLMASPMTMVIFIIYIIILQQVDGNIIGPKILGDSTGLSSFWVLVSIIVGGGLFGLPGMLIGVPTFAVIYSILGDIISSRLDIKNIKTDTDANLILLAETGLASLDSLDEIVKQAPEKLIDDTKSKKAKK